MKGMVVKLKPLNDSDNRRGMGKYTEPERREIERLTRAFEEAKRKGEEGWSSIEAGITEKRINWLKENEQILAGLEGDDLEKAYHLLLMDYLGIDPREVPVVEKTERRIVWRSRNPCPVIEACRVLGLDTREICKRVYERPAQALVSKINPELLFKRNYEKIRPHASYCEEMIELRRKIPFPQPPNNWKSRVVSHITYSFGAI